MKKIVTVLCAVMLATTINAQKASQVKVPTLVSNAFNKKFPKAVNAKWEMEDVKNYEANFKLDHKEYSAVFNALGLWMETEMEIKTAELPEVVSQIISKQFSGYKIKEAEKVEKKASGHSFEVELKKGGEIIEVAISPNGEVLSIKNEGKEKNVKD